MLTEDETLIRSKFLGKMLVNNVIEQNTLEPKKLSDDREINLQAEIDWANERTRLVLDQYHRQRFEAYPRL